jgi:Ca2+-binding EF-hand superfamily protein
MAASSEAAGQQAAPPAADAQAASEVEPLDPADDLLRRLRILPGRVIDAFRVMDDDLTGTIDKKEFRLGVTALLTRRRTDTPPPAEVMDELFNRIDLDRSGDINLKELDKALRLGIARGIQLDKKLQVGGAGEIELKAKNATKVKRKKEDRLTVKAVLEMKAIRDGFQRPEDALRIALSENSVRVIDLFRDWDVNHDGKIDRDEFTGGIKHFGFPGGEAAAALFDQWDSDGSGALTFAELNAVLRRGVDFRGGGWLAQVARENKFHAVTQHRETYAVNITPRRNWSRKKVDGASGVVLHLAPGRQPADAELLKGPLKKSAQAPSPERERSAKSLSLVKDSPNSSMQSASTKLQDEIRSRSANMHSWSWRKPSPPREQNALVTVLTTAQRVHRDEVAKLKEERYAQAKARDAPFVLDPMAERIFASPLAAGGDDIPPLQPPPRRPKPLQFAPRQRALSARPSQRPDSSSLTQRSSKSVNLAARPSSARHTSTIFAPIAIRPSSTSHEATSHEEGWLMQMLRRRPSWSHLPPPVAPQHPQPLADQGSSTDDNIAVSQPPASGDARSFKPQRSRPRTVPRRINVVIDDEEIEASGRDILTRANSRISALTVATSNVRRDVRSELATAQPSSRPPWDHNVLMGSGLYKLDERGRPLTVRPRKQ